MKREIALLSLLALSALAPSAGAADQLSWRNHAAPFTFLFGNEFDTHQQTRLTSDGVLSGFLYITYTGVVTRDGYRVATHADCSATPCSIGWSLDGEPASAKFLYQIEPDHPVFQVKRADIPQPGAHGHFHWLGAFPSPGQIRAGYLLELSALSTFCFIHHMASDATSDRTCRENGGVAIVPGIDIASHLNIVTSSPF